LVAKLTYRPVNGEPRRREVAGFLRFPQYPQGFTRGRALFSEPARSSESAGLPPKSRVTKFLVRELSDSLSENGDPVNNPVAFQVCEGNALRTAIVGIVFMPAPLAASEFRPALAQTA